MNDKLKFGNPDKILWISIAVFIFVHLWFINLPPCSIHVWRQCNTLSVAQNFYDEGYNILQPKVDRRFEGNGITGTAFPLYEWLLALIYKLSGVHYWVHRLFSLTISITGIWFAFLFLNTISSNRLIAALSCSLLLWSPEYFYHSINALPDIFAICTGFISLYLISKSNKSNLIILLSYFFLAISGLLKIQYLMIGVFHLIDFINDFKAKKSLNRSQLLKIICGIICISIVLSWYKYSLFLIEKSNLRDFGIEIRSASNFHEGLSTLKKNLISDFPELVFGFANTILIVTGIYYSLKKLKHTFIVSFIGLIIVYTFYHLLELRQMQVHQYYMMPVYFIVTALIYQGLNFLFQKKLSVLIIVLLIAQPILACIRIIPARWGKSDLGISRSFSDENKLNELKKMIPSNARVIAGPDESGCIYLYFLHKKGFGYERNFQLTERKNDKLLIKDYIDRGASYLITSNASDVENDTLTNYFKKTVKYNEFYIIELKK